MPEPYREATRVVVLGASQATGYRLEARPDVRRRDRAFPALLHSDPSGEFTVTTFAGNGRNMDEVLAGLDEAIALRPDVVICIGGGRESIVRANYVVNKCRRSIPVKGIAHTPRYHGVERLQAVPWQLMVWMLNRDSVRVERLAMRVGFGPEMPTERYVEALDEVVDRILTETAAHIFIMRDFSAWRGEYAWWGPQRAANHAAGVRLASTSERITALSALAAVPDVCEWLPDGAHVTEAGHARLARWLAGQIRVVTAASGRPVSGMMERASTPRCHRG